MALFNRGPYPGGIPGRRSGFRTLLLILGIVFGLYFLNLAFLWVKIPALGASTLKLFNIITGIILVVLGIMSAVRPRMY